MPQPSVSELIDDLFGRAGHSLAGWYAGLLSSTPALRTFTVDHRAKIRKKVRSAADEESRRDLRCELAVAALLAADRRSPLVYEPLAAEGRRGPDFLVRHKGHTAVYVEVSRLRARAAAEREPHERLAAVLCGKLGQLPPDGANLLVLVNDDAPADGAVVEAAIQGLRRRAEAKDDAYFAFRGLAGARELLRRLPLLGGVFIASPAARLEELHRHGAARRPLPADFARAVAGWSLAAMVGGVREGL